MTSDLCEFWEGDQFFGQNLDNSKYKKLNRNSVSSALHRSLSLSKESYTVYVNIFERIL